MRAAIQLMSKSKEQIKSYGLAGTATYFAISFSSLGTCYYLVKQNKGYIQEMLESKGISTKSFEYGSDFLIAYVAHKTTQPLRLCLTGALFPIVRKLARR
ncbi:transmembrane protein, putative (macronuclear) [Tetrahymena thermophila SB210]|uniref:Transmembrane protein, putative n=1 Tax=Tetrahymena thermophila (strain SB210) TaxID=312017 RepID=A4VEZ9_TETTS|nr:transmembrane protein, putative [Tetrahymena thermophila SB210]EDK31273.1 transmembrane protein, putative [Tetrahymena thermophila SB210]|eukprot:XP_001470689.1 transmembrane protein, putative [Tetrahymena thermophila SB210]